MWMMQEIGCIWNEFGVWNIWVNAGSMVFTSCVGLVAVWEDREHVNC